MLQTRPKRIFSVMIVDDHAMFRQALSVALSQYSHLEVTDEVGSGEAALAQLQESSPDVVLMDISLPGMTGIEATRRALEFRQVPIIILSMHERKAYESLAKAAGAKAYAMKTDPLDELVNLMNEVVAGG